MKRFGVLLSLAVLAGAAFGGGIWYANRVTAASFHKHERKILYWVDPMHPSYKSDKPGIAPDCGMKLEPVYDDGGPPDPDPYAGKRAILPPGTIQVNPEKQQLIGVAFTTAEMTSTTETVRAVGKVAVDETRITRIHPRIEGWISEVSVDFTGKVVKQGEPLLTLYSPEMVASEQEFLLALRARDAMSNSHNEEAAANSDALVTASRHRLERWDLSKGQMQELESTRIPIRSVTLYSPASGYVLARNAFPSQKVTPETELYTLADLSHAWIMVDVFETDIGKVQTGQPAWVTLPNQAGHGFAAHVDYIQPLVDPATRTMKIRLDAPNPDLRLKPDLFVNVEFRIASGARVSVPSDAVVDTGTRQTVFVDLGDGNLEPREVQTGGRIGDRIQILSGLKQGERVVASGTFLIDSEARFKNGSSDGGRANHGGGHGHD